MFSTIFVILWIKQRRKKITCANTIECKNWNKYIEGNLLMTSKYWRWMKRQKDFLVLDFFIDKKEVVFACFFFYIGSFLSNFEILLFRKLAVNSCVLGLLNTLFFSSPLALVSLLKTVRHKKRDKIKVSNIKFFIIAIQMFIPVKSG